MQTEQCVPIEQHHSMKIACCRSSFATDRSMESFLLFFAFCLLLVWQRWEGVWLGAMCDFPCCGLSCIC